MDILTAEMNGWRFSERHSPSGPKPSYRKRIEETELDIGVSLPPKNVSQVVSYSSGFPETIYIGNITYVLFKASSHVEFLQ